jgi:hypothetical protein
LDKSPAVGQAEAKPAKEISPEDYRKRVSTVREEISSALKKIQESEAAGKSFSAPTLKMALREREKSLGAESTANPSALAAIRLDIDELLAVYGEELARTGDKAAAIRSLANRSAEFSRGWLVRGEHDPRIRGLGTGVLLMVTERNFFFNASDETALDKGDVAMLDTERAEFLENEIVVAAKPKTGDVQLGPISASSAKPGPMHK